MNPVRHAAALAALVLALAACEVKVDENSAARLENAAESAGATVENVAESAGNLAETTADQVGNAADGLGKVDVDVRTGGNETASNRQ
ncbi:MAG: hypothetical protein QOJ27_514 [Sphingomonadales bacterium]|nr:hypothetical protein [Sphingomonadales bacterium]